MNNPDPSASGYSAASEVATRRKRRSRFERLRIEMSKAPVSAWFGLIVVSAYVSVALFAPLFAPFGEAEIFPTTQFDICVDAAFYFRLDYFQSYHHYRRTRFDPCFSPDALGRYQCGGNGLR